MLAANAKGGAMFNKDMTKNATGINSLLIQLTVLINIILLSKLNKLIQLLSLSLIRQPNCPGVRSFASFRS